MRALVITANLLALVACKASGPIAPSLSKPATNGSGSGAAAAAGSGVLDAIAGKTVLDAKYAVNVKALGISLCKGTGKLVINIPAKGATGDGAGPVDVQCLALSCAFGKQVNIDSLLGGLSAKSGSGSAAGGVAVDEQFLRLKGNGVSTFTPPLILLPNVAGADPNFLKTMQTQQAVALHDADGKVDTSGQQTVATLGYDQTYTGTPISGVSFDKVFHFSVENDGFAGADKLKNALFDSIDARVNLDPLALLDLAIKTKVADLLPLLSGAGAPPPSTGQCGTPPPEPQDSGGILKNLLSGAGGSGGGGILGGGSGTLGRIAGLLTKLIDVEFDISLLDQQGLKEAYDKKKAFDELAASQNSGSGSAP